MKSGILIKKKRALQQYTISCNAFSFKIICLTQEKIKNLIFLLPKVNPNKAIIKISNYSESPSLLNYKVLCFLEYILPDKIRQEEHHDTNRTPSPQDGHQTKQQISYTGSSWRGWLWHYLRWHGRGTVPEGSRKRIFPEGSDYEE